MNGHSYFTVENIIRIKLNVLNSSLNKTDLFLCSWILCFLTYTLRFVWQVSNFRWSILRLNLSNLPTLHHPVNWFPRFVEAMCKCYLIHRKIFSMWKCYLRSYVVMRARIFRRGTLHRQKKKLVWLGWVRLG